MAKQIINEELKKKALEYRELTFEKYNQTIAELESRKQALLLEPSSKKQKQELKSCEEMISRFRTDVENIKAISEEMFVQVVLDRELLLNVITAFDQGKIEKRESSVIPVEKALEIAEQRKTRKSKYRKMSIDELLDVVMDNERLEIELLRIKEKYNLSKGDKAQTAEPASNQEG